MVVLATAGGSIQPSRPTMPPYTPNIKPPSPPASKRSTKYHQQRNFRAFSIFRTSGTEIAVANHHKLARTPDHDESTLPAARHHPVSLFTTSGNRNTTSLILYDTANDRVALQSSDRPLTRSITHVTKRQTTTSTMTTLPTLNTKK